MGRLTWLAVELRRADLKVIEVDGWKTRGSTEFDPIGVTWHATAGSRTSSAQGEVNVILNGSATAPPPIAQIMAYRDGALYICAAGRCNHNKIGWDGPNKGLGNSRLLGIEMANDNRGEPWPNVQLDAVRRATAVIMRRLGADPMRRLAAHYEHQPYGTRPPGEGSTKSDPYGVVMTKERPLVAAIMNGEDDMATITQADFNARMDAWWNARLSPNAKDNPQRTALRVAPWQQTVGGSGRSTHNVLFGDMLALIRRAADDDTDEGAVARLVLAGLGGPDSDPEQLAAALRTVLGDAAPAVGRLLAA